MRINRTLRHPLSPTCCLWGSFFDLLFTYVYYYTYVDRMGGI